MKKSILLITILSLSTLSMAQRADHKAALYQLIEDFRTSTIEHDNPEKFYNLFLNENITWSAIYTGKSKLNIEKKRPGFSTYDSNIKKFYTYLSDGMEERFYNIEIEVRNDFATVSFDYSFLKGGDIQNWGTEYWSVLLVNDQWKITSVTWSMNMQNVEPCPFAEMEHFTLNQSR